MWVLPNSLRLAIFCLIQAFGLFAGDREERTVAAGNLLGSVILVTGSPYYGSNVPLELGLDFCLFGLSIVIALRSDKVWPLPFASLMLLALLTDVAQMLEHVQTWAFGTAQVTWELSSDLALAWGTWQAWRRRRSGRATSGAAAAA